MSFGNEAPEVTLLAPQVDRGCLELDEVLSSPNPEAPPPPSSGVQKKILSPMLPNWPKLQPELSNVAPWYCGHRFSKSKQRDPSPHK